MYDMPAFSFLVLSFAEADVPKCLKAGIGTSTPHFCQCPRLLAFMTWSHSW